MSRFQTALVIGLLLALSLTACSAIEQYQRGALTSPGETSPQATAPPLPTEAAEVAPTAEPPPPDLPPSPVLTADSTPVPPDPTPTAKLPFVPGFGGISLGTPKPTGEAAPAPTGEPTPSFIAADNTVLMEIAGLPICEAVVVSGPAIEIERIPGFTLDRPDDNPGRTTVSPFVFEYSGENEAELGRYHDDFMAGGRPPRVMTMIVRDLSGEEAFRWNFFEFGISKIAPGLQGRSRYTFTPPSVADLSLRREGDFLAQPSKNPQTDTRMEIEGVQTGQYPVVDLDTSDRTITLTFDYAEGGDIWPWVVETTRGHGSKRSMSIIEEDPAVPVDRRTGYGQEIARKNYFGVFPIKYEQFTGFNLVDKIKERVVLSYSFAEDAR